ncbi:MAG TPA: hypothetical protein VEJ41_08670 [Candidatus Acidoferrales bacterium]|nr:hypothetical protein [Candidatus Acidoferrales bacterium]
MKRIAMTWSVFLPVAALAVVAGTLLVSTPARADVSPDSSGDVVVLGGQHEIVRPDQEVTGDLVVIGGSADIYGKVDGDAAAIGGRIYIAPHGHVAGSLVNVGGVIDNESNSSGTPVRPMPSPLMTFPSPEPIMPPQPPQPSFDWGWTWFYLVDALLTIVAFLLFPALVRQAATNMIDNAVMAGVLGFFSPIILVLVIIALAITIIGIPLIPLAILVSILGYLVGKAAIAEFLGDRIFRSTSKQSNPVGAVLIGTAILFVVCSITGWIGIVLYFSLVAVSVGAALPMLRAIAPRKPPTPIVPPSAPTFSPPVDPAQITPPAPQ